MASKISVTLDDGTVITRKTARKYTHVVVLTFCRAGRAAEVQTIVKLAGMYHDDVIETLAKDPELRTKYSWTAQYDNADHFRTAELAKYQAVAAQSRDAYQAAALERETAETARREARGDYTTPQAYAWCGRLDLAQKQADNARKCQSYTNVRIVAVPAY